VNPITAAVLLLVSVDGGLTADADGVAAMTARLDSLYAHRDDKVAWAEQQKLAEKALGRAPADYGVLWRAARVYFWMSDDTAVSNDQRSQWGKQGWDIAERAIKANPSDVAGHYYAAVCMGNYALGLGVVRALSQGLEGKFKERLKRAEELEPKYQHGGVFIAWGRFYDKLPWPKRDRKKAQQYERQALQLNPANLRARVYLASSLIDDDHQQEAKTLLDEVMTAPVGRYDTPEEQRAKGLAAALLAKLK
jgi:hypothetical protein